VARWLKLDKRTISMLQCKVDAGRKDAMYDAVALLVGLSAAAALARVLWYAATVRRGAHAEQKRED
jgi:hypothetical protein